MSYLNLNPEQAGSGKEANQASKRANWQQAFWLSKGPL
jgi:hypothetical protein